MTKKAAIFAMVLFLGGSAACAQQEKVNPLSYKDYHELAVNIDEKAHTVGLDRFLELMAQPDTVVIDLRDEETYTREHIKGAINLGADITAEKLQSAIPSKDSTILLYCSNSLYPTRMIALTDLGLPQFVALGYEHTYKLEPIWHDAMDGDAIKRLPMVKEDQP